MNPGIFHQLLPLLWLIWLILIFVILYPYVRIIRRAGFSGWWILVMFVPLLNFIMLWVFAFAEWPALRPNRTQADRHVEPTGPV